MYTRVWQRCADADILASAEIAYCSRTRPQLSIDRHPTFYSFAVHAVVVSVIVHYLSHAKNHDWLIDWLSAQCAHCWYPVLQAAMSAMFYVLSWTPNQKLQCERSERCYEWYRVQTTERLVDYKIETENQRALSRLYRPTRDEQLVTFEGHDTIRYGRVTCTKKLTIWPA